MLNYTYGPQKAATIRLIAERDNLDLTESWAYSDSATDLPMLEAVGHPVVVNPDRALRRIAQMRGWPVLRFSEVMVVTPDGHRPLRAGLLGAASAVVAARPALGHSPHRQTSLEQRRQWKSEDKGPLPRPFADLRPGLSYAARSFFAARKPTPTMRARNISFLNMPPTVVPRGA